MTAVPHGPDPRATARIDVVVPARDEELHIRDCLDALFVARDVLRTERPTVECGIVVVLDDCVDATPALVADAARHRPALTVLEARLGSVGPARLLGVTHALDQVGPPIRDRWIASTDADSRVDPGWLVQQADALTRGVEVLIGAVVPDPRDLTADVRERWRLAHPPGATLGHVHGANLGIRADAYVSVGGYRAVDEHEDVLLVEQARAMGLRVEATEDLPVVTSGRFVGRTPGGYADHLRRTYAEPVSAPE